jgi:hypothetical protein
MDTYRFLVLFRIILILSIIALLTGCSGRGGSGKVSSESAPTFKISGTVGGYAQENFPIILSGTNSGTTTTDASGNYSFSGLTDGSYTVTPILFWYTFTPCSKAVTINGSDVSAIDFTSYAANNGFKYSISGVITVGGMAKQGVVVTLSGTNSGTAATDDSGHYSFSNLVNGSYTLTPSITEYTFTPTSQAVTINGGDVGAIDFTATDLSP